MARQHSRDRLAGIKRTLPQLRSTHLCSLPPREALTAGLWLSAVWAMGFNGDTLSSDPVTTLVTLVGGVVLISLLMPLVLIDIDHL